MKLLSNLFSIKYYAFIFRIKEIQKYMYQNTSNKCKQEKLKKKQNVSK